MLKKELIDTIEGFNDDSEVVFITEIRDLLTLESDGSGIHIAVEVNNGTKTVIALME